jgi:hypothetical protein
MKEFRVFILESDNEFDTNGYMIENWKEYEKVTNTLDEQAEKYISVCEKLGTVYSLNGFETALNLQEIDLSNSWIYITNNY